MSKVNENGMNLRREKNAKAKYTQLRAVRVMLQSIWACEKTYTIEPKDFRLHEHGRCILGSAVSGGHPEDAGRKAPKITRRRLIWSSFPSWTGTISCCCMMPDHQKASSARVYPKSLCAEIMSLPCGRLQFP